MALNWTDDLNTGIPEVDAQNQRLADFINTLQEAKESDDRERLGEVLEEMLDFCVNQFFFEEQLMEKADYEFRSAHERVHEIFIKKLADFRGRYANGEDVNAELLAMLNSWVQNHVAREDKAYAASVSRVIAKEGGRNWVAGLFKRLKR
jgi:hemerythrin